MIAVRCGLLLVVAAVGVAQPRLLTLADLGQIVGVSDPQLAPSGATLAYVRTRTDYAADRVSSEIVLADVASGREIRSLPGSAPRWSPDGKKIAYRHSHEGQSGIWMYDLAAAGPRFLTTVHVSDHWTGRGSVKNFAWSPDSATIAFAGADPPGPKPDSEVRVFTRIMYKTRTGFSDSRRTHLWVVPASGGQPRCVTPGKFDEHSLSWSPDGKQLVFVSNRSADPDNNYSDDLWTVEVATLQVRQLTRTPAAEFRPAWSPDGSQIAFLGWSRPHNTKDSPAEDTQLYVMPSAGGTPRKLSGPLDRRVSDLLWHPNGRAIYFTAGDRGAMVIHRVSLAAGRDGGTVEEVVRGNLQASQPALDGKGSRLAWIQSSLTHPAEVWTATGEGRNAKAFTRENEAFSRAVALQDAESLWFDSFDGTRVQGWLMKPAAFRDGQKYPLLLYIHGGPHGMYGYAFSDRFQLAAARGYGVLFLNPRGSSGYGQTFSDGSVLNWGGGDYQDLMAGLDHALARSPWIDPNRLGVTGGSYGGFMTNWVITQTPRFKAAVSSASVSNLISFYGTSLYTDLIEAEFNGLPWNNWGMLWQWSPLNHIRRAVTPTLLLHGELDHDVPITQAEEMYIALRKLGVEAMLVRYPGEGHGLRRPKHILDAQQRTFDWFDKFLKQDPGQE